MSPQGLFIYLTVAERAALRTSALARMTSGERTSLSGGGKSGSKAWQMSPQEVLAELLYAAQILGEVPRRAQKVVQVLNDQYPTTYEASTIVIP